MVAQYILDLKDSFVILPICQEDGHEDGPWYYQDKKKYLQKQETFIYKYKKMEFCKYLTCQYLKSTMCKRKLIVQCCSIFEKMTTKWTRILEN